MMETLVKSDFNMLANLISENKCILLLGPEIAVDDHGTSLTEDIKTYFKDDGLKYDMDGFLVFKKDDNAKKIQYENKLKQYFIEKSKPAGFHKLLAQIPFHLVITLSPDLLLYNAFREYRGEDVRYQYYNRKVNPGNIEKPTSDSPLIYSIFGSLKHPRSLVLTSRDMIDLIDAILGTHHLPEVIKQQMESAEAFIFLGFDFESWYLKLLLNLIKKQNDALQYAIISKKINRRIYSFYIHNYEMKFVEGHTGEIVDQLYDEWRSINAPKTPDNKSEASENYDLYYMNLLKKAQLQEVLELFDNYEETMEKHDPELYESYILVSNRYHNLEKEKDRGLIPREEYNIEFARIAASLRNIGRSLSILLKNI